MERQEFLKTLGISFAAVCVGSCISACGKKDEATPAQNTPPPPAGTTLSADLSRFGVIGAKVLVGNIAIFRIAAGDTAAAFIATEPVCTHQQGALIWEPNNNLILCTRHAAEFDKNGINTKRPNVPGSASNLRTYTSITVADGKVNVIV